MVWFSADGTVDSIRSAAVAKGPSQPFTRVRISKFFQTFLGFCPLNELGSAVRCSRSPRLPACSVLGAGYDTLWSTAAPRSRCCTGGFDWITRQPALAQGTAEELRLCSEPSSTQPPAAPSSCERTSRLCIYCTISMQ